MTGLFKILGITLLLLLLWALLSYYIPQKFLLPNNIENLMRRTALFGVLGIGVAFVIISSGIDLSIGSLVCFSAALLATFLHVDYVELDSRDVWSVDSQTQSVVVSDTESYQVGDHVWFYKDRRNNGLQKIVSIDVADSSGRRTLICEGSKKSVESDDGKPVATTTKVFSVTSLEPVDKSDTDAATLQLDSQFPPLRRNDKIQFVHPTESSREAVIDVASGGGLYTLKSTPRSVNREFFAVPIRRTPRMTIPLAILSVLGITLLLGLIHGLLITKLNLQPFVVTLCGLLIYRGFSRRLTDDQTVGFIEYGETLGKLATGRWEIWSSVDGSETFGIPYSFFIFVAFTLTAMVFLNLTVWGRHLMAVGRNEEAARYSGINTRRVVILAYVVCAVLTGIGGMMFAIDSNSIAPSSFGNFFELYAIAAAVLGGCSLRGGEGSILGVVVGTTLMQTLYTAIMLLKIPDEMEFTIIGAVILVGVSADELLHRLAVFWKSRWG